MIQVPVVLVGERVSDYGVYNTLSSLISTHPDGDTLTREQMRLVLRLAVALWGDLPTDCDPGKLNYNITYIKSA